MSLICALILGWVDRRAERILQRNNNPLGEIAKLGFDDIIALGGLFFMDKFYLTSNEAYNVNSFVNLISAEASSYWVL